MKAYRAEPKLHHRLRYALRRLLGHRRFPHRGVPPQVIETFEDYQAEAPELCRIQVLRDTYAFSCSNPRIESDSIRSEFEMDARIQHPPFRLVTLRDVHLRSRNMLLLTPDERRVFLETSRTRYNLEYDTVRECWQNFPVTRRSGSYFLAFNRWGYNYYYHWMVDTLCRFSALDAVPEDVRIIMPRKTRPYMLRSLELLGIDRNRFVSFDDSDWQLEECWFAARGYTPLKPSVREVLPLRDRLCAALGPVPAGRRRLYISRSNCSDRRLCNEEEINELLSRHGFERYFPEDHRLDDQIHAFRSAEAIIGSFGSGLTNILFCPAGTPVYVFYDHSYFDSCIWILGHCVDLTMHGIGYDPAAPVPLPHLKAFLDTLPALN